MFHLKSFSRRSFATVSWAPKVIVSSGKSHVNLYLRQLLTDYYTQAFKNSAVPKPVTESEPSEIEDDSRHVESLVKKAELVLETKSNVDVASLVGMAIKFNLLVTDFNSFAKQQQRLREDQDLLLFSLIL